MNKAEALLALAQGKRVAGNSWSDTVYPCFMIMDERGHIWDEEGNDIDWNDVVGGEGFCIRGEPTHYWNYMLDTEHGGGRLYVTTRRYTRAELDGEFMGCSAGYTLIGIVEGV